MNTVDSIREIESEIADINRRLIGVRGGGGGVLSFLDLTDTPANYAGDAAKFVQVNAGETALEFNLVTAEDVQPGTFPAGNFIFQGNIDLLANSIVGTGVDINNAELQQLSAIGATTISAAQWGYLGACGAGGGQIMANLTAAESTQLEAIGVTTISAAQWGYLGASDQGFSTGLSPTYVGLTLSGAIATPTTITTSSWIHLDADSIELRLGAEVNDYTIQWDGADAVHTVVAGDFAFMGGNFGIGTAAPGYSLHAIGSGYFSIDLTVNDDLFVNDEAHIYEIRPTPLGGTRLVNSQGNLVGYMNSRGVGAASSGPVQVTDEFNLMFGTDKDYSIAYRNADDSLIISAGVDFATPRMIFDSSGNVWLPTDGAELQFGDVNTDYTIQWDGADAVHTIVAGDFVFLGGPFGIGTSNVPHGGVGIGMFAIDGANADSGGPSVQFTTVTDDYPLMSLYNWAHDDLGVLFDCYYDGGAFASSDAGSSFAILKGRTFADKLRIVYDVVAAGGGITWNEGITLDTNGLATLQQAKIGGAANYSQFAVDGTLSFVGDATVWDDMRVPLTSVKLGGVKDPTFAVWKTDGAASRGVWAWSFADQAVANNEEELFFVAQLPHSYKEGSDITCHVHWTPAVSGNLNEFVKWGLEYAWADIDESFAANTTIIYSDASGAATATSSGDATLIAGKHYLSDFAILTGTNYKISSVLICRVFRHSSDADDDLAQAAIAFEVDFHFEKDTVGSREILTK